MRGVPRDFGSGRGDRPLPSDPYVISRGRASDMAYWTMVLGTTAESVRNAVYRAGPDVEEVALYLRGMRH